MLVEHHCPRDGVEDTAVSMPSWTLTFSSMHEAHRTTNWNLGRVYKEKTMLKLESAEFG